MGKLKNRHRSKKSKPFSNGNSAPNNGNADPNKVTEEEDEFSRVMADVVEKLESPSVMEKLSALLLLSEMVDMKQIRSIIIDHEICKIVGPLLLDTDTQVCLNAAGAIRNLTSCGEEEVLEALVEQDVLTPVLSLLGKLTQTLHKPDSLECSMDVDGVKSTRKGAKAECTEWEEKIDLACQVVNTLWNLCETCATVLKYVNNEEVMSAFVKFLNADTYDISLSIAAAQFLHMLSEDNTFVIKYLIQHQALLEAGFNATEDVDPDNVNGSAILLQALYAGILQNITPNFFTKDPSTFKVVSQILSINQRLVLNQLTSDLPRASERSGKQRIDSLTHLISAQKLILEFITNLCSSDEDEDNEGISCGGGMDVDIADDDQEAASIVETRIKLSPELHDRFVEVDIFRVVLQKIDLPAVNVCEILRSEDDYKHLMDKLIKLQCTGFLCINNLVSCMDNIPTETLFTQFITILCHHYTDKLSEEQCEALTCALRSLLLSLNEAVASNTSSISSLIQDPSILKTITTSGASVPEDPLFHISKLLIGKLRSGGDKTVDVNMNLMKVVSLWMSCLLKTNRPGSQDHDIFVISKLLQFLDTTDHLILLAEILDCLIDVFSDDDTDLLAKQVNLVGKLTASEPRLKNMIKSNKKSLESEKLALVSTVQTNLHAFIQYKRERVANMKS